MKSSLRFSASGGRHPLSRLRPRSRSRLPLPGVLLSTALALLAAPASTLEAQVREGISLGVTPTAERIFWNDDLALEESWYYGGRASLNFGRFVALEGYYLTSDDVEAAGVGTLDGARRYGGDVVFTFANWDLTPFVRAGAGVSEFEVSDGAENEILTGTAAAGIRFDLFDRLQTQVFAQDIVFRASSGSPLVDADGTGEEGNETFHNLALGAGINLYLGGQARQSATDLAFQDGLHGVASPLELYGGEIQWDNALGIADLTVAGARLGVDFGPYVGLHGYYFGSVDNDLDDFTDYMGYGAEGRFNLTRSDEAFTPFLVLGGGRVHFPDSVAAAAGLGDDKKWNGVLGAGVGFNVTERLRLEASARDVLLSRAEPDEVTAPDQLHHSWMFTGGLRFSLAGDTDEAPRPVPRVPEGPFVEAAGEPGAAGDTVRPARERAGGAAAGMTPEEETELARQIRALRAEVDSLRRDVRGEEPADRRAAPGREVRPLGAAGPADTTTADADAAAADTTGSRRAAPRPAAPATIQLPVLEDGEIYIRFGASGTFERVEREAERTPGPELPPEGAEVRAPGRPVTGPARETGPGGAGAAPVDSLREAMGRMERELDSLRTASRRDEERRGEERVRRTEARLEELRRELERLERGEGGRVRVEIEGEEPAEDLAVEGVRGSRGVLRGDPLRIGRISPYAGVSFHEPNQLLLGLKADVGSAFGGGARVVPDLAFGVTDDFTWNANAHVEWPLPLGLERARPFVGGGLGILGDGDTELLIPNVVAGASYPVGRYEVFGVLQGLDFFDDTRVVFGIHTRPPAFLRAGDSEPTTVRARWQAEGAEPRRATTAEDSARITERARAEAELRRLDREREVLLEELEAARRAGAEAARRAEEAAGPTAAGPSGELSAAEGLRRELAELVDAPAVSEVRRTDHGASIVLGGGQVFPSGSAELSGAARSTLRRLADVLVRRPGVRVVVEGHTDARGAASLNERLSLRRAESVGAALVASGVEAGRISATGYGESRPLAGDATSEGRARNRRVEVILVAPR